MVKFIKDSRGIAQATRLEFLILQLLLSLFVLLQYGDMAMSKVAIIDYYMTELNPLADFIIKTWGVVGLFWLKFSSTLIIFSCISKISLKNIRTANWLALAIVIIMSLVNILLIQSILIIKDIL